MIPKLDLNLNVIKEPSFKELKIDLENKFTMQKLRALENRAAIIIQRNWKAYATRMA